MPQGPAPMSLPITFGSVFLLAAVLTIPVVGQAQGEEPIAVPEIQVLKRLDRNEDGFLTQTEIPSEMRIFVASLIRRSLALNSVDKTTGRIDLQLLFTKLEEALEKRAAPLHPKPKKITNRQSLQYAAAIITLYDSNQDQFLEAEEFEKLSFGWVQCDLNLDLRLDVVEVASGLKYTLNFPKTTDGTFDETQFAADRAELIQCYKQVQLEFAKKAAQPARKQASGDPRRFAESFLATHDQDQNGTLDSDELKQIGPSWLEVDFDSDGKATVDEIQVRFQHYEAQRLSQRPNEREEIASPVDSASAKPSGSRFPPSLEFDRLDANQNGQIEMYEFASDFDDAVIADYYRRDFNGDAVITLKEWNRYQASQNKNVSKPESKSEAEQKK
jgi:Ca2+-binding EF-hand superfamily protein